MGEWQHSLVVQLKDKGLKAGNNFQRTCPLTYKGCSNLLERRGI